MRAISVQRFFSGEPVPLTSGLKTMRMRFRRFFGAACVAFFVAATGLWWGLQPASAEQTAPSPQHFLQRVFTAEEYPDTWFAPVFLSKVSPTELHDVIDQLKKKYGAFEGVELSSGRYYVHLADAMVPIEIGVDANGRVFDLRAKTPIRKYADFDAALTSLSDFPGDVSMLVLQNGRERTSLKPDTALAVGSAYKIAVMNALVDQVKSGKRSWAQVIALTDDNRALPTGILQNWPAGMQLTLESLAGLMISLSDNTAADTLIHVVGRDAVEAVAPTVRPFLTSREAMILKAPANTALRERYAEGDLATRRQILAEVDTLPLPTAAEIVHVYSPNAEWRLSVRQLCDLIAPVADQPAMQINPGVAIAEQWARVSFKGGGDFGVVNLTTELTADDGTTWCAAVTWNNPKGLREDVLFPIYGGLLQLLKATKG